MAVKTVTASHFPVGTAVQAFRLLDADIERREGRVPVADPLASGVIGAGRAVDIDADPGEYILFAVTNEVQSIKVDATSGQFVLKLGEEETADIAYNATAAKVREELEALEAVGEGNVEVTGGPGDSGGTKPYVVTFIGDLSGQNIGALVAEDGEEELAGGGAAVTAATTTQGSRAPAGDPLTLIFTVDAE